MRPIILFIFLLLLSISFHGSSQSGKVKKEKEASHKEGEWQEAKEMPQFKGGHQKMMEFIKENLRYPEEAQAQEVRGVVVVSFFVETNGALTEPKIVKGLGFGCDEEAIRIVRTMPNWEPIKNKPERVNVAIPVRFGEKIKKEGE